MNISPELKQQLAEQKKQCVFCKLISGEMPDAKKVFEDDKTIALLDISPAVKGHTLFMTKEHYPMPAYMPSEEFKQMFSLIPSLGKAVKNAMVRTGLNVFIALGGAAGQQSPHFMVHLLPREDEDGFFNFLFGKKGEVLREEEQKMLAQHLSQIMQNHFARNPAPWHSGAGSIPPFLEKIKAASKTLYEDEKVLCVFPEKSAGKGHLVIYSKMEEKEIEKLSQEDAAHLFSMASLASTAVFEGLKAQGTNILLKSGRCDDNLSGMLEIHILPRWQDDKLQGLMWQPKQASYDLDSIVAKIKDKTWNVKYKKEEKKEKSAEGKKEVKESKPKPLTTPDEEIIKAIERLRQ